MPVTSETIGPAARNLARYTESLATASFWSTGNTGTVTDDQGLGPDGELSLARLDDDDGANYFAVYHDFTIVDGQSYTFSTYFRADTSSSFRLELRQIGTGTPTSGINVNPSTGGVTAFTDTGPAGARYSVVPIVQYPGLYRAQVTLEAQTSVSASMRAEIQPDRSATSGTGATFFGMVQFEQSTYATTYQPVTGSTDPYEGDYADIGAWLTATQDLDLAAGAGDIREGQLTSDVYEIDSASASMLLAQTGTGTRSSIGFRRLEPAGFVEGYQPWRHVGPRIYVRWADQTGDQIGLDIDEDWFQLWNVGIFSDDSREVPAGASDVKTLVRIRGSNVIVRGVTAVAEHDGFRDDTTGPFFYCFHVNGSSGDEATDVFFFNCIAKGSRWNKGATYGFFFDSFSERGAYDAGDVLVGSGLHGCWHCAAYEFTRGASPRGFYSLSATAQLGPEMVNCVAAIGNKPNGASFSGLFSRYAYNASDDSSAIATGFGSGSRNSLGTTGQDPGSIGGVNPTSIWTRPEALDFRMTLSSALRDSGLDDLNSLFNQTQLSFPAAFLGDMDGVGRGEFWSIGPYERIGERPTALPYEETYDVGDEVYRAYQTPQQFLSDHEHRHLYNENVRIVGEVHRDGTTVYDLGTASVKAYRAISYGKERRRVLRAASTVDAAFNRWQPHTGVGVHLLSEGGTDAADASTILILESYFRLEGMKVENDYTGAVNKSAVQARAPYAEIDSVEATMLSGTGAINRAVDFWSDGGRVTNVIARGGGSGTAGATRGILMRECQNAAIFHCIADQVDGNGSSYGFQEGSRADRVRISNCIGAASGDADYFHNTSTDAGSTQSNNVSTDATAAGPGSLTGATRSALFSLSITGDLRHLSTSVALNAGTNLFGEVTTDWNQNARLNPPDCGAYEGVTTVQPDMGTRVVRNDLARLCNLYRILRKDGVPFYFTDANEPITFRGNQYVPTNGVNATAKLAASGLQESSFSTVGAIDSAAITETDLRAGRFDQAQIDWYLIDWQYPWATPVQWKRFYTDNLSHTGEVWNADFVGPSSKLEKRAGRLITVGCPYVLGDSECGVDISADTLSPVAVDSVSQNRLQFDADSVDIPVSYADDFFGTGEIFWLTGNNAGTTSECKTYTSSTRTIALENETALIIQVGDTFRIKPGCRKRYIEDCIGKHDNGPRFGGDPFIPPASEQFDAPRR